MNDIIIDGKKYNFISRKRLNNKNYIIFEDNDSLYVSEYILDGEELELIDTDIETQKKVLESIGINYGI